MFEYVESVSLEGALEKQGKLKTWSWRKYWFVLDEDQLCYYKDSQRASAVGLIDLAQAKTVKELTDLNHGFPFEISTNVRSHILSAETKEDQQKWIKFLEHAMILSWRRSSSMFRASCHSISDDEDIEARLKEAGADLDETVDVFNNNKQKDGVFNAESGKTTNSSTNQYNRVSASPLMSNSNSNSSQKSTIKDTKASRGQYHKNDKYRRCVSAGPTEMHLKLQQSAAVIKGMSNSDGAVNTHDKSEKKITYPLSILRKAPARHHHLKSCSDVLAMNDLESSDTAENRVQSSGSETWTYESPTLKLYKKSQHYLANDNTLPLRQNSNHDSAFEEDSATSKELQTQHSSNQSKVSAHKVFSEASGARKKVKIALSRNYIKSLSSMPSSHSPEDAPGEMDYPETQPSPKILNEQYKNDSVHEDVATKFTHLSADTLSDTLTKEQLLNLQKYLNVSFPPIPELPNPRLELTFNSPCDSIRMFLAQNRGPMEIYPVPRKSERGGKAIRTLKTMLERLETS